MTFERDIEAILARDDYVLRLFVDGLGNRVLNLQLAEPGMAPNEDVEWVHAPTFEEAAAMLRRKLAEGGRQ